MKKIFVILFSLIISTAVEAALPAIDIHTPNGSKSASFRLAKVYFLPDWSENGMKFDGTDEKPCTEVCPQKTDYDCQYGTESYVNSCGLTCTRCLECYGCEAQGYIHNPCPDNGICLNDCCNKLHKLTGCNSGYVLDGSSCRKETCSENASLCNNTTQKCVNGACVDKDCSEYPNKCTSNQTCVNKECVNKDCNNTPSLCTATEKCLLQNGKYQCVCSPACTDETNCPDGSSPIANGCGGTCAVCNTIFVSTETELLAAIKEPLRKTIAVKAGTTITTAKSIALLEGQSLVGAKYYDSSAAQSKLVLNYDSSRLAALRPQDKAIISDLDIDLNIKSSVGEDAAAIVIKDTGSVQLKNLKITVNGGSYNTWKVGVLAKNADYTLNGTMDFDIKGSTENAGISNDNSIGTVSSGAIVNIYNTSTENGRGMFVNNHSEFNIANGATLNIRTSGINGNGIENNIGTLLISGTVNILSTGQYGSGIVNNNWSTYGGSTVSVLGTGRVNIQTTAQNGEALNNPASNYNPGSGIVPNVMYLYAGCEISFKVGYSGSQGRWRMGNFHTIYDGSGGINSFVNGYNGISLLSSIGNTVTVKLSR